MSLIGDFQKASATTSALNSLLPQKVSPKKLLASTIGATFVSNALPKLSRPAESKDAAETAEAEETVSLPPLNMSQTFISDSDPSSTNTATGFMASSQPAPSKPSKWKLMAQAAKQEMASTQPVDQESRQASKVLRLLTSQDLKPIEDNIEIFAEKLVETFGSLSAAFEEFDHHGRDEITRSQWDAALNARGWNTEELCGIPSSKLFSLVSRASKKPMGALTLPAWKSFFKKYLNRSAAHLLTEERTPIDPGVTAMLEHFQAPSPSEHDIKASTNGSNDGIYESRRKAFIQRPLEDLAKLHAAANGNSDDEDGQQTPSVASKDGDATLPTLVGQDQNGDDPRSNLDAHGKMSNKPGEGDEDGKNHLGINRINEAAAGVGGPSSTGSIGNGQLSDANAGHAGDLNANARDRRLAGVLTGLPTGDGSEKSHFGEDDRFGDARSRLGQVDPDHVPNDAPTVDTSASSRPMPGSDADALHGAGRGGAGGNAGAGSLEGVSGLVGSRMTSEAGGKGGKDGKDGEDGKKGSAKLEETSLLNRHGRENSFQAADAAGKNDHGDDGLEGVGEVGDTTLEQENTGPGDMTQDVAEEEVKHDNQATSVLLQALQADDEEISSEAEAEPEMGKADDFQSIVKRVFRLYATGYSKGRYVFIRNPDLARFMEDSRSMLPGYRRKFRRLKRIFESLFDDTIQLQCDMPGQGLRITAGLTLEWFQVFVQKVVRRVGIEVMSFFAALLESQLC